MMSYKRLLPIIVSNLLPVIGVWFFGWDLYSIFLLYWVETLIIIFFGVARLLSAPWLTRIYLVQMVGFLVVFTGLLVVSSKNIIAVLLPYWSAISISALSYGFSFVDDLFINRDNRKLDARGVWRNSLVRTVSIVLLFLVGGLGLALLGVSHPNRYFVLVFVLIKFGGDLVLSAGRKERKPQLA